MKRLIAAVVLAVAAPAGAQIAAAIGKPLPSSDLPVGTVSVRIVAGSPANPVIGTDVTLVVGGTPRLARTDTAGRVFFKDLPPGATVQAKVTDEDKKEITSDSFELPSDSGVRLLLSTKPFQAGGGGAPFAGGAGGQAMPEPRQMSGEPRLEPNDPPGTLTVRLTYDDFKDAPPTGVPVHLVAYNAKDLVDLQVVVSDKDGRAQFSGLDRTGATSYFALAELPRGAGVDRLMSTPVVLEPRAGVRLILSSDKRTSSAPPIDDIERIEKQESAVAEGKLRVTLEGVPDPAAEVTLMTVAPGQHPVALAHRKPELAPPDPNDIRAEAQFSSKPDVPPGALEVQIHGGASGANEPIPDIEVRVVPASSDKVVGGVTAVTAKDGWVRIEKLPLDAPQKMVVTVHGKQLISKPFDLAKTGGAMDVSVEWDGRGKPEVTFDVDPQARVIYAETTMRGQLYRSAPVQPVAGHGTRVTLFVYPRVMFSFSLTSHIDDEYLAVSGRFELSNYSWAPYVAGPDGLVVPLPRHFKGAIVAEQDQGDVSVAQGEGFRLARPIPPGGRQFHGGFSLPVEHGTLDWSLDLPLGAFQSGMEILQVPGMTVKLPPNVTGDTMTVPQGTFFVLPRISILPKQAMVMSISGLPSPPMWRVWVPRIVGVFAVSVMLGGLAFALLRRREVSRAEDVRQAKRAKLLDELVELDRSGKPDQRREAVLAELEQLWD